MTLAIGQIRQFDFSQYKTPSAGLKKQNKTKQNFKTLCLEFSGNPLVRTPPFHGRGPWSDPWSED